MSDEVETEKGAEIISLRTGKPEDRVYETTLISNARRYGQANCPHKGPFTIDRKLATVECGDCGSLLNPMYVLELMACHETYWNMRQRDLTEYLTLVNKEIDERARTKCTHCGNMTAIRYKKEMPRTWMPTAY